MSRSIKLGILGTVKTIVTHQSADLDAIMSVWIIKRFLPGWDSADVAFVPAGNRIDRAEKKHSDPFGHSRNATSPIEHIDGRDVIHVDTGLGPLDHHQTDDSSVCAASLCYDYVLSHSKSPLQDNPIKHESVMRMVDYAVDIDHFQELFYPHARCDVYDFSLVGIIDGYKMTHTYSDNELVEYVFSALDAVLHTLENKLFAKQEIEERGREFESVWGKGLSIETVNDATMKLALKQGFVVVVRRDPKHGFVRIKARPSKSDHSIFSKGSDTESDQAVNNEVDLTEVYEKLVDKDPDATWFLHASKKMLLNGSSKNPHSRATKLSMEDIVFLLSK